MDTEADDQQVWNNLEVHTLDLLDHELYQANIHRALDEGQTRVEINIDHLRQLDPKLPPLLLNHPAHAIQVMERALDNVVQREMETLKKSVQRYRVAFDGNFGTHHISPRGLKSELTNKLVKLQGIVTRMSLVRPKLMSSQHYCEKTKKFLDKNYSDQYDLAVLQSTGVNNAIPAHDPDGNAYSFEYGLSTYKNHQTLTVQELPERSPPGHLPRSAEVIMEEDLVDRVKPGDRIEVVGVYKTISVGTTSSLGVFRTVIIANNVYSVTNELSAPPLTGDDVKNIKEVARRTDILDLLSLSFAPSIQGHEFIKESLVLLLLSGMEKNLENGTHLRGDINILLIGDPSTAKSQLLRSILHIAPLATNTTGRGASGVGLTAAVVQDKQTGERHLEAGAMVLADRGVICIDEFDKMSELDRVSIHEVMEQQTVTIAKAGIHASLNARCSVVAAANPLYGTYQRDRSPSWNIAMPDSLLSRFDLLFVVLDQKMPEFDRLIAGKVISNHLTGKSAGFQDMDLDNPVVEPLPAADAQEEEGQVYVSYQDTNIFHRSFLKKYIYYAKQTTTPVLSDEASTAISQLWAELRSDNDNSNRRQIVPITVRTLETLIRLSTAVAKASLQNQITVSHVEAAIRLLNFALYNEANEPRQTPPSATQEEDSAKRRKVDEQQVLVEPRPEKVTRAMRRAVFKILTDLGEGSTLSLEDLLRRTKSAHAPIEDLEQLLRVVMELQEDNKVFFDESEHNVTLL